MTPKIMGRTVMYAGYLKIEKLQIELSDGALVTRDVATHGDAAAVLPYDRARRCALVARLFRAPVFSVTGESSSLEACAGMIDDDDEDEAATARREAMEELGVELHDLRRVARIWSSPGVSTERQTLFLATYANADRLGAGGGVAAEHEGITVLEQPLTALARDLDAGRIEDGKLVILLLALRATEPELFTGDCTTSPSSGLPASE